MVFLGKLSTTLSIAAVVASTLSVCSTAAPALEDYAVPAVDFTALTSSSSQAALLGAMQKDGIVALQNVPNYASLRAKYLAKAAACAVTAQENKAEFLLFRKLTDGTKRFTISTESGRKLQESGKETLEHCPGYLEVYHEFSQLVEDAVVGVGKALDATKALQIQTGSDVALTARELMEDSVHLDHFHAYQAAENTPSQQRKLSSYGSYKDSSQLSLEMHTDNGLMIAMTAPEYFDVADSGEVRAKQTRSEDAGLVIKTFESKTVRPVLKADELVLMLGSGVDQWIKTSPKLHPVMHGMRFPRGLSYADVDAKEHKVLRAWFGKMILLKADHVMENTGLSYGEYANHTTRYLMETSADLGFAAVACPPNRRLQASDNKCMTKTCTPKAGADTSKMIESCQVTCNHEATDDVKLCAQNCECESESVAGHRCWMLCVEDLSTDVCLGTQKCNDAYQKSKLAMTCAAGTTAPITTTAPTTAPTPAPTPTPTPSPVTTAPKTSTTPSPTVDSSASQEGNGKVVAPVIGGSSASSRSTSASAGVDTSIEGLEDITKNSASKSSASSTAGSVAKKNTTTTSTAGPREATTASFSVGVASVIASIVLAVAQH